MNTPTERFLKWMYSRKDGVYKELNMKYYCDGEPYFSHLGAEISLSEFLKIENLNNNQQTI